LDYLSLQGYNSVMVVVVVVVVVQEPLYYISFITLPICGWSESPALKFNWVIVSNVVLTLSFCLLIFCFGVLKEISNSTKILNRRELCIIENNLVDSFEHSSFS
jgi:hypothetical protein